MRSDNTTINQDGASSSLQRIRPLHGRNSGPTRRSTKGQWTPEEDEMLYKAVQQFQGKNWKKIAECFKDRSDVQCLHRWQKVLNPELIKGPWSKEEDERIVELVNKYGPKKWSTIAQHLPGRIGKQCRERWHNHLNPGINKEAWSQEEELTLIRAHQIYGNKWAELTKFFPGRSDNAIKNHWNSSVKKKLDSYLASGLLAQFQGLSYVGQQTSSTPSSSLRIQQSSGEESVPKDGAEAEEISECSQGSGAVGCSQSGSEKANGVLHVREECQTMEESCQGKEQNSNTALCSGKYYASIEEINYCVPDIQCKQGGSPKLFAQSISHHDGTSMSRLCQYNLHELPNSSLPTHFIDPHEKHEVIPGVLQNSLGLSSSTSVGISIMGSEKPEGVLTPKGNTSRIGFAEAGPGACFSSESLIKCSNIVDLIDCTDSVPYESSNFQKPETARTSVSQLFYPLKWSDMSGSSCCESFLSSSSILPVDDDTILNSAEPNQLNDLSVGNLKQEIVGKSLDGFLCPNGSADSTFNDGTDAAGLQDLVDSSSKLVHEDVFQLVSSDVMDGHCIDEKPAICAEQGDAGGLCYEPPRFPSVDIPFFSCDLIQSGSEMQYSPLGIRQLMTSSVNCMTPFRLWDSPSKDDGPDAMLKSAAKTFTCTPSILKKRQRDLLSPLSEKRFDKKLASNFSQEFSTSSLARDFSRLDVMFKETESPKASPCSPSYNENKKLEPHSEDKENICPEMGKEEKRDGTGKVNADADAQVEQSYGAFIECNLNDLLFFSPVQVGLKPERVLGSSAASSRRHGKESQVASNQITFPQSSARNQCLSDISSPTVYKKKHDNHPTAVPPRNYAPSTDPDVTAENKRNIAGIENFNMFGETPFKRSLESPSAWKSPWFFNSFFPRVNGELSIEDFGYFMSPGDRSYDAIGLMKQLNEHTAATFANAQAILGNETPETILKERLSNHQNTEQENNHAANGDLKNSPPFSSNILGERRILDFSDCDSPAKETENGKGSAAISFSSPSSYLLKGCR